MGGTDVSNLTPAQNATLGVVAGTLEVTCQIASATSTLRVLPRRD